jgi:hypothetical protein
VTILRIFLMYEPLRIFAILSMLPGLAGVVLLLRYLYFFLIGEGSGHVQSVIAGSALGILAFQVFLLGLLADLIARNRRLMEDTLYHARRLSYGRGAQLSPEALSTDPAVETAQRPAEGSVRISDSRRADRPPA